MKPYLYKKQMFYTSYSKENEEIGIFSVFFALVSTQSSQVEVIRYCIRMPRMASILEDFYNKILNNLS